MIYLKNSFTWFVFVSMNALLFVQQLVFAEGPALPAGSAPVAAPAAAAPVQPQAPGIMGGIVPILAMFAIIYFLMLRPQQKKMKEQQQMISALQHGDDVITSAGILGKIAGITEKVVTLDVGDNVRIKILKSQVAQVIKGNLKDINA